MNKTIETICDELGQRYGMPSVDLQIGFTKVWIEMAASDERKEVQEAMKLLEDVFNI